MIPTTGRPPCQRNAPHKAVVPLEYARPMDRVFRSWNRWPLVITLTVATVTVIGIALITLPMTFTSYRGHRTQQSDTNAKMVRVGTAIHNFYQDYNRYPTNAEGLNILVTGVKLPDGSQSP